MWNQKVLMKFLKLQKIKQKIRMVTILIYSHLSFKSRTILEIKINEQ